MGIKIIRCGRYLALAVFLPFITCAQESKPGKIIICYKAAAGDPLQADRKTSNLRYENSSEILADFEITYTGFPAEAKKAFQFAVSIWSDELHSDIPIRVGASWDTLKNNFLASTRPTKLYRGFHGAVRPDIWYPVSLAEKIMGEELNESTASDIEITINKNTKWYFGTDGNPPYGYTDLVSAVLHELAHGLGFSSSADVKDDEGYLHDENYLYIYDMLLENNQRTRLSTFQDPSKNLETQLTSDEIFLYSPSSITSSGQYPKVFAPSFFIVGSSIAHLDESTYPKGDPNALMTPYFSLNESNHALGNILHGILLDLGWRDQSQNNYSISIYPNPSDETFNLKIEMPVSIDVVSMTIVDLTGRNVMSKTILINESPEQIKLSDWPNGVYIVSVSAPDITIREKIILIK